MKTSWMMVAQMRWIALWGALAIILVACGDDKVAGGTEAESTIALYVQQADGKPASMARVRILPDNYLSSGPAENAWNETNEDGYVSFEVRNGRYTIEARNVSKSKASGAVHTIKLDAKASDSQIDTIKLGSLILPVWKPIRTKTPMRSPSYFRVLASTINRQRVRCSLRHQALPKSSSTMFPARCALRFPVM